MSEQAVINRLDDILEQTEYIISAVSGLTFEEFISNPLCSAGVIRFFEIIGEAARNILLHPCADLSGNSMEETGRIEKCSDSRISCS